MGLPAPASGDGFLVEALAEGVYWHRGAMAELDSPARGDSANLGFIVGERCVAVIDSGGAMATARALAAAIATRTDTPVCYVINTHVHFDHVLGNQVFAARGAQVVGSARLREAMAANREFFAAAFAAELGGPGHEDDVIGPELLVETTRELDLGDRVLELTAVANAHSGTDLTVFDRRTGTLWTGDLLFRERMPVLDGSLRGWLAWMDDAGARTYALVIPGHGSPDRAWPAGAAAQRAYLEALLGDTRAAVAAGTFIEDAKRSVAADARARWLLTERAHGLNVSRAYRELEWE